ncbi:hypothetical protein MMC34_001767 [Xylographa carneopallida]|nr:hypothetical protein [Xylographa carneopallida]
MLFSKTIILSFLAAVTAVSAYGGQYLHERDLYARDAYAEAEASDIEFLQEIMRRDAGRSPSPMRYVLTCSLSQCDSACDCSSSGSVRCGSHTVAGHEVSAATMTAQCKKSCHC